MAPVAQGVPDLHTATSSCALSAVTHETSEQPDRPRAPACARGVAHGGNPQRQADRRQSPTTPPTDRHPQLTATKKPNTATVNHVRGRTYQASAGIAHMFEKRSDAPIFVKVFGVCGGGFPLEWR